MKPSEGMWWGIVENTKDPKHRNRIIAKVPDVLGSELTDWADPDSLVISKLKRGDKVWVRFLGGDIRHPVYHIPYHHTKKGILYNSEDKTELNTVGALRLRAPGSSAMMSGSSSAVSATGGKVHCQGKDGAGYVPCVASAFEVGSTEAVKENIRPIDFDPVAAISAAPSRLWNYLPSYADDKTRVGPIAETLPEVLRSGDQVDLTSMIGVMWAAIEQLSSRVAELESAAQ